MSTVADTTADAADAIGTVESQKNDGDGEGTAAVLKEEPLDMLARVRRERADRLASAAAKHSRAKGSAAAARDLFDGDHDLEMSLRMVRGLLTTNQEIWDRCISRSATSQNNFHDVDGKPFFTRFVHREVSIEHHKYSRTTSFAVTIEYERIMADKHLPTNLPKELQALIVAPKVHGFPNYPKCFDNAMTLQDDVLVPFLTLFRKHLEEVQVGLGKVDEWLGEAEDIKSFLEDVLKVKIEEPVAANNGCQDCRESHKAETLCLNCGNTYSQHHRGGSYLSYSTNPTLHLCPRSGNTASYLATEKQFVKKVDSTGKYFDSFDVCTEAGRSKLEKFVAFLED